MTTKPLKYLFTATFADGTQIVQSPDDKSELEPERRSQFYDVLKLAEQKQLIAFALKGEGHEYGVDLRDGHFEIDGMSFRMHETEVYGFRVIFFRQHTHSFNVDAEKNEELSHEIVYQLGWQCTVDGKNYQRIMQIS